MLESAFIIIGRFGRTHGIKGNISVVSFTDPVDNIFSYTPWYIHKNGRWISIKRLKDELKDTRLYTLIEGYHDRETAALLTNQDIAVSKDALPTLSAEEYYWHELVGMTVLNTNGTDFGMVKELISTGSNDVLIVQGDRRRLIPYIMKDIIVSIDRESRKIIVDWDADF